MLLRRVRLLVMMRLGMIVAGRRRDEDAWLLLSAGLGSAVLVCMYVVVDDSIVLPRETPPSPDDCW